jgi:hypothetical protein
MSDLQLYDFLALAVDGVEQAASLTDRITLAKNPWLGG